MIAVGPQARKTSHLTGGVSLVKIMANQLNPTIFAYPLMVGAMCDQVSLIGL